MHGAPRAERKAVEPPWPTNASAFATQSVENNVTERAQPRRTRRWSSTSFRIAKDERAIRPIWYHREDSVKAHLLVCLLACELWRTLSGWMTNSGLGCAPRTLLEEMAKLKSGPITLAANRPNEAQPRQINLGCSAGPAEAQNVLLHRPGLNLARRLQRLDHPVQMQ